MRRADDDANPPSPSGVPNAPTDLLPPDLPVPPLLPVLPYNPDDPPDKNPRTNAATAASAASVRAITSQAVAFYFRAPAKAFFRTRVDYLAYARGIYQTRLELAQAAAAAQDAPGPGGRAWLRRVKGWLGGTTPGVLTSAVRHHGWGVIPEQILPPLVANVGVAAVLYTSYLTILGTLHEESAKSSKRVYPPPSPDQTFTAGLLAGGIQSLAAAPLDAIQARYDHQEVMSRHPNSRPPSMWAFSAEKLREIGTRGIFAGWGLSLVKDSFGSAVFFSTFEYVKAQGYYNFVRWYYGGLDEDIVDLLARKRPHSSAYPVIRPHYAIEPMFLLLAGTSASLGQQILLHPLTHIQVEHWNHLEDLDEKSRRLRAVPVSGSMITRLRWRMFRAYYRAYQETWAQCRSEAKAEGRSVMGWLYRGFWWNTLRQVPSTSAGLIIFELVRRKYGMTGDEVRITKDGYDILLS
ncbi:related to mitochondrial carrier protein [Cephalotrichum gorgonifer]|uniref:Related to mitochondrial carrier protein n=1 Tax=Cephalotrichum gorgonifer TaxID=2041049 RepID=A0AAE8SYW6_9PEZI|nr:related to mitochondrial carrier protein [Cephalotrichum gorgonifer]